MAAAAMPVSKGAVDMAAVAEAEASPEA
ncbi:protein of unknown function [Rhodovastum atsumiense]|nr:protein of unknown function [Rhodovastum atsumiense]